MTEAAFASVTFDPATGKGFIGRGDIVSNPDLGKTALTFTPVVEYWQTVLVVQECQKDTLRTTVTVSMQRKRDVRTAVETETRKAPGNKNITGYTLKGYSSSFSTLPAVLCPDNFVPVGTPTTTVLAQYLTFTGNGLTGVVWRGL